MERVAVFRFMYTDRVSGLEMLSSDYATLDAIRELGGVALEASKLLVGVGLVSRSGLLTRSAAQDELGLPFLKF